MQARKLRDSLCQISDGLHQWGSKTLIVAEAYKKLANLITDTPTQLTETKAFHGMWLTVSLGYVYTGLNWISFRLSWKWSRTASNRSQFAPGKLQVQFSTFLDLFQFQKGPVVAGPA